MLIAHFHSHNCSLDCALSSFKPLMPAYEAARQRLPNHACMKMITCNFS
jgi:hypothetical protein